MTPASRPSCGPGMRGTNERNRGGAPVGRELDMTTLTWQEIETLISDLTEAAKSIDAIEDELRKLDPDHTPELRRATKAELKSRWTSGIYSIRRCLFRMSLPLCRVLDNLVDRKFSVTSMDGDEG